VLDADADRPGLELRLIAAGLPAHDKRPAIAGQRDTFEQPAQPSEATQKYDWVAITRHLYQYTLCPLIMS
jgi:hypothetical protein